MNAAARILLQLDAQDIWAEGRVRSSNADAVLFGVEPVVVAGGGDQFGTLAGLITTGELQDAVNLWTYRMKQLAQAYADFSPAWVARDQAGYIAWTNDWTALQTRMSAALADANATFTLTPAQTRYDALAKAARACYPPDGCPVVKGDWSDLFDRLNAAKAASGSPAVVDNPPQPTAVDYDIQAFKATAPVDVVAQVTGAQLSGPLPGNSPLLGFLKWVTAHEEGILIGGALVIGGVLLVQFLPAIMLPFKVGKGIAALAV
jgi:hypothetical protein